MRGSEVSARQTPRAVARAPGAVGRGEAQHRAGQVGDLGGRRPRVQLDAQG